jgi:dUTP pyrophosphatase
MTYLLKLQILDNTISNYYINAVNKLNTKEYENNKHKDSGFDILIPQEYKFNAHETCLIDLGIRCAVYKITNINIGDQHSTINTPQPFYMYSRSSIYKTPFRLANNVGIIDSGYRGNLMGAFDNITDNEQCIQNKSRLLQICMPDLSPFKVVIVKNIDNTIRGNGGFGSTG